ncbi:MAG: bifunctional phosphoribosylaminoimidazolecarboxamide formyltransferase/IMP cyclohydrolase, partial [Candidatus Ranarchaeia archaeon]
MIKEPVALISVYDKSDLGWLCGLLNEKYSLIATKGTAKYLAKLGFSATLVEELTGAAEILGGRVKTLHPHIFAGILSRRTPEDRHTLMAQGIPEIDVVVCNLYPFSHEKELHEAIELIDIGGPSLVRAAAKNYHNVTVLVDPYDYEEIGKALAHGKPSLSEREKLALKAFEHVAEYNIRISRYFQNRSPHPFPQRIFFTATTPRHLRYGENSHQKAVYYLLDGQEPFFQQKHGKEVSYNNIADFSAGLRLIQEFSGPTCAILKHRSPCGVAENKSLCQAFKDAFGTDSLSAYGGIAVFNRPVDGETAKAIMEVYVDGILAPGYSEAAYKVLTKRKKIILLQTEKFSLPLYEVVPVPNGMLVQEPDYKVLTKDDVKVVSTRQPTESDLRDLLWGWRVTRNCRSNAVVLSKKGRTVGIGSGSPSRVDAVLFALKKAGKRANGSVMTSDAFFPFPDSIEKAGEAGIRAIMAPGGSIRD